MRRIAEFSVRNFQFTIVAFLLAIAVGVSSLLNIPRAEDPSFPIPQYVVVAVYPGASPTDVSWSPRGSSTASRT